jgi:hypothetical protein
MKSSDIVHSERARLGQELGRTVTADQMKTLDREGYLAEWRNPDTHDPAIEDIRTWLEKVHTAPDHITLDEFGARAAAESEIFAELAGADSAIATFRTDALDGRVLGDPAEALRFLRSTAATSVPYSMYRDSAGVVASVRRQPGSAPQRVELPYLTGSGHVVTLRADRDSVVGELRKLCAILEGRYPWKPAAAAAFVVEGSVPLVSSLSASIAAAGSTLPPRITLTIDPWVPERDVARFYGELRRSLHRRRGRLISEQGAALVAFVLRRRRETADVTWRDLLSEWRADHPDYVDDDSRHFYQAFTRARRSLGPANRRTWS